jgi:hypothetical protein
MLVQQQQHSTSTGVCKHTQQAHSSKPDHPQQQPLTCRPYIAFILTTLPYNILCCCPQIQFYNFEVGGFAENTGHFTQLIWRDSVRIGCAANLRCAYKTYICQYQVPGQQQQEGSSSTCSNWSSAWSRDKGYLPC